MDGIVTGQNENLQEKCEKDECSGSEMVGGLNVIALPPFPELRATVHKCSELPFAGTSAMNAPFWEVCNVHCAVYFEGPC